MPPIPSGTYAVYAGCDVPDTTYLRTVYIDPVSGSDAGDGSVAKPFKSFATATNGHLIKEGDHVVLLPGSHVAFQVSQYNNPALQHTTKWIWLDFRPGAVMESMDIRAMDRWLITNPEVSAPATPKWLISLAGGSNIVIADGNLYTVKDASGWDANRWINGADSGVNDDNATCVAMLRNHITNVRLGLQVFTRAASTDPAANSMKALVVDNVVKNFSADGMRPLGSDITLYHNSIIDEYADQSDGDGNHDDGIQGFALNGAVYTNVVIDHNWVQETTDPSRKLIGGMQGISSFDGVYTNSRITNNVVITSVWHGLAWYGDSNMLIDHNTVANYSANGRNSWITAHDGKDNAHPVNVTVSNNTAVDYVIAAGGVTSTNNYKVPNPVAAYTAFDPAHNQYDFTPKPGGPLDGKGAGVGNMTPLARGNSTPTPTAIAHVSPQTSHAGPALLAAVDTPIVGLFARIEHFFLSLWQSLLRIL